MKRSRILWMMVVLNAALAVGVGWKFWGNNPAHAQVAARGDIAMAPARLTGSSNGVVWVLETRRGLLGGFVFDGRRDLQPLPPLDLRLVFGGGPPPVPPGPGIPPR